MQEALEKWDTLVLVEAQARRDKWAILGNQVPLDKLVTLDLWDKLDHPDLLDQPGQKETSDLRVHQDLLEVRVIEGIKELLVLLDLKGPWVIRAIQDSPGTLDHKEIKVP